MNDRLKNEIGSMISNGVNHDDRLYSMFFHILESKINKLLIEYEVKIHQLGRKIDQLEKELVFKDVPDA